MDWSVIFSWIIEHLPTIALIVITAAITTVVVWRISKFHDRFLKVEDHVNTAPCNSHINDIAELKKERENMASISANINTIAKWIMKFDSSTIDSLAKCSPYRILPHGYALLELSQVKQCVDDNFDFFKEYINERKPETEYDVENIASLSASSSMLQSFMNPVKDFLYSAPEKMDISADGEEKKISISSLLMNQLIGIYVRDKYLALFEGKKDYFYFE